MARDVLLPTSVSTQSQGFLEPIPQQTTHVFHCPCCRNETLVLSPQSFIALERTTCQSCGNDFIIENDRARLFRCEDNPGKIQ